MKEANRAHFLKLYEVGRVNSGAFAYNYIILQLTLANLEDARQYFSGGKYPPATATRLCLQSLQAVHDIHLSVTVCR